jgi:hypothetical protein
MPRKFRVVRTDDPATIFDDIGALRAAMPVATKRARTAETFARVPHDRARALYRHIGGPAWFLLIELDRLVFEGRGRNPVRLTSATRKAAGLSRWGHDRGLCLLEKAGVIKIERKRGRCPLVTLLWYPVQT